MKNSSSTIPQFELRSVQSDFPKVRISDSSQAADYIRQFYNGDIDIFESSFILLLNNQLRTIGYAKISQGGITGTVIDPRIVAHYAVKSLAPHVIIAHNHPSGDPSPSPDDIAFTEEAIEAGALLDIPVLDHLVFGQGPGRWISMRERRLGFA